MSTLVNVSFQINGEDVTDATHDQVVSCLTVPFADEINLVVYREHLVPKNTPLSTPHRSPLHIQDVPQNRRSQSNNNEQFLEPQHTLQTFTAPLPVETSPSQTNGGGSIASSDSRLVGQFPSDSSSALVVDSATNNQEKANSVNLYNNSTDAGINGEAQDNPIEVSFSSEVLHGFI